VSDVPPAHNLHTGPRLAENANQPGEYRVAIRIVQAEVDPGDQLRVEIYVTGYGQIYGSKLIFYPPPYFIDEEQSTVFHGLDVQEVEGERRFVFGTTEQRFKDFGGDPGMLLTIGGIALPGWEKATPYVDVDFQSDTATSKAIGLTFMEQKLLRAPIELLLKVRKKAPSGHHDLRFYLTYFNGEVWKTDSQAVSLSVRNLFQRHPYITWIIGSVGAALALGSFARTNWDILSNILYTIGY
jgi:hypothetical protein